MQSEAAKQWGAKKQTQGSNVLSKHFMKIKKLSGIFAGLVFYHITVFLPYWSFIWACQSANIGKMSLRPLPPQKKQLLITWHHPITDKIHSLCSVARLPMDFTVVYISLLISPLISFICMGNYYFKVVMIMAPVLWPLLLLTVRPVVQMFLARHYGSLLILYHGFL